MRMVEGHGKSEGTERMDSSDVVIVSIRLLGFGFTASVLSVV